MKCWYVYMVRCSDNSLYTGICKELERRIYEHNHDNALASAYARSRRPVTLVYQEMYRTRSDATKREIEIKMLSKSEKEILVQQ